MGSYGTSVVRGSHIWMEVLKINSDRTAGADPGILEGGVMVKKPGRSKFQTDEQKDLGGGLNPLIQERLVLSDYVCRRGKVLILCTTKLGLRSMLYTRFQEVLIQAFTPQEWYC